MSLVKGRQYYSRALPLRQSTHASTSYEMTVTSGKIGTTLYRIAYTEYTTDRSGCSEEVGEVYSVILTARSAARSATPRLCHSE